jgi:hypothetical protein
VARILGGQIAWRGRGTEHRIGPPEGSAAEGLRQAAQACLVVAFERRRRPGWIDWGATHSAVIVDQGNPLGKTKRASPDGVADVKNAITGYVIIQAESHEAAAKLFENHPHFAIFPGDSVEIMECLPLPSR